MNPINQLDRIFCSAVFNVYRRQNKFLEHVGTNKWSFDIASHTFEIVGGQRWGAQIIGIETPEGTWRWAWGKGAKTFSEGSVALSKVLKQWGKDIGIQEFTVSRIPRQQLICGGHTLGVISAAQTPYHPYFAMPQEDGDTLFIVVNDFEYPGKLERLPGEEFGNVFARLINDFHIPDEALALTSALDSEGYEIIKYPNLITGVREDGSIEAEIDEQNRLLAFNVR